MRTLILAAAAAGALATPLPAQDAAADVEAMTCGEFLALDPDAQLDAMLAIRGSYNGEPVDEPTPVAAEDAAGGNAEGAEAGVAMNAEQGEGDASAADPKLTGMRTACQGAPDVLALDAMIAAHADYE